MKTILYISLFSLSLNSFAKVASKVDFAYGATYLGPSLSSDYQDGATYNRSSSGQDYKGDENDYKSSVQTYQSLSIGYRLSKDYKISYGFTFQNNLNKGIEYNTYNSDGSIYATNERKQGFSANNQRVNLLVTNIYSNNSGFFMSNFYYERPTTEASKGINMTYGLGFQPTIGIYTNIPAFMQSISATLARTYYKSQEYDKPCNGYTCHYKHRTLEASISYNASYNFTDKLRLKGRIVFDWDQQGDQVDDLEDFNDNMDNIIEIGPSYQLDRKMSIGGKIQAAISDPKIEKTAMIFNFNLNL